MTWTSEAVLSGEVLAAVMRAMDRTPKMHEGNMSYDVLDGAYEYLLKRFSDGSGTRAGPFFTPPLRRRGGGSGNVADTTNTRIGVAQLFVVPPAGDAPALPPEASAVMTWSYASSV
jgi:hypothetical protein